MHKYVLILYHENISVRFPAHYRLPFLSYLKEWGYEVRLIGFGDHIDDVRTKQDIFCIPKYKASHMCQIPLEYLRTHLYLKKAIDGIIDKGFRPDIIISFNHPVLSKLAEKYSHKYQAKHVIHIGHLMAESKIGSRDWATRLKGHCSLIMRNRQLKRADQIWVMSEEMKRYFSRMLDRKKIKVWPSAVSTEIDPSVYKSKRIKLRKELGIDLKDKIIVYIGTLSRLRGLEFVLDSMKIILDKMANVKLLFIGYSLNGKDLAFLKKYANQIDVKDHIIFHPRVIEDELPYYIEMCHVGISPFMPTFILKHNSPLKLLEYFKAGVPVVATDIPEQRIIISESQAGLLVKWDEKEFADAVIKILSLSKGEKRIWGYKGYEWAKKNRDIEKMTKSMLEWFKEL